MTRKYTSRVEFPCITYNTYIFDYAKINQYTIFWTSVKWIHSIKYNSFLYLVEQYSVFQRVRLIVLFTSRNELYSAFKNYLQPILMI